MPMRISKQFHPLESVLKTVSSEWGLQNGVNLYKLANHWGEVVGYPIALHSFPEKIRFRTLTLGVENAPWKNELLFFKTEILHKTNQFFKKTLIDDLIFRVVSPYPRPAKSMSGAEKKEPLPMPPEAADLEEEMNALGDEDLRATIRQALMVYFSSTRILK